MVVAWGNSPDLDRITGRWYDEVAPESGKTGPAVRVFRRRAREVDSGP
ncbi:MAG: hypothetical protein U0835_06105 [Isosphaeraceae bacterium]